MPDTGYAWSTIYNGGETREGRDGRTLVVKRNETAFGAKVTRADFKKAGVSDEEWDAMFEGGSIRSYPPPKLPEGYGGSPAEFVLSKLRAGESDISTDVILGLALKHPDGDPEELAES